MDACCESRPSAAKDFSSLRSSRCNKQRCGARFSCARPRLVTARLVTALNLIGALATDGATNTLPHRNLNTFESLGARNQIERAELVSYPSVIRGNRDHIDSNSPRQR